MLQHSIVIASTTQRFQFEQGISIEDGIRKMLSDPQLTVEELEEGLKSRLNNEDWVFEIAELGHFRIHMLWILSQIRMRQKGGNLGVLSVRGNGGMRRLKVFYDRP